MYLVSMSVQSSFSTAIRDHHSDHQMTTKQKMNTRFVKIRQIAGIEKTTVQKPFAVTVEPQDST